METLKWIYFLPVLIIFGCNQPEEELPSDKKMQIKKDIIRVSEKHAQDLVNKDFEEVMKFYGDDKNYIFSKNAASYLVEFNNERIEETGDTTLVTGCFTYGMRKIEDQWKAVTVHISHNYKPGYGFERSHVGYDAEKNGRNWWKYYSCLLYTSPSPRDGLLSRMP